MRFIATILSLTSVLSSVSRFGVILSFKLNQEYIAKTLCENRFDKSSTCDGKCYLKKQLQKQDTEESKSKHIHLKTEDFTLQQASAILTELFFSIQDIDHISYIIQRKLTDYIDSIFHPPTL